MMKMLRIVFSVIALLIANLLFSLPAFAATINDFESYINVQPNSAVLVTETINITTDQSIQHGIYRDFPTRYKSADGRDVYILFQVKDATLDNRAVQYHIQDLENGVRIYLGSKDKILPVGTYTFTLTYTATGELGFFADHDELYWNVTGNGWNYPITQAQAIVQLPSGAAEKITGLTAYTGYQGSREQNYKSYQTADQTIVFQTTQELLPHQGLTIVVGWPKGFVHSPSFWQSLTQNSNNLILAILAIGSLVSYIYCFYALRKVGSNNKETRAVIPEYEPPTGFTPDALRFILEMGYDNKVLTAAIINLAVKGYLKISETKSFLSKTYTLEKQPNFAGDLTKSESILVDALFAEDNSITLKHQTMLETMVKDYQAQLNKDYKSTYFSWNRKTVLTSIFIIFITLGLTVLFNFALFETLYSVFFLLIFVSYTLKSADTRSNKIYMVIIVLVASMFGIGALSNLADPIFATTSNIYVILMCSLLLPNFLFAYLMKRPTIKGQQLINHILGFKLFLNATEKDRLNFRNPPNRTPEMFEKFLPYAIALGVENAWSEQFSHILANANYQPRWYSSPSLAAFNAATFTSSVSGAFAGAISSATTPPGRSSGFVGGSSGGGGGGGGGGGW